MAEEKHTEYIEREAALNNLAKSYFACVLDDLIHAEDAVNAVPAADVVKVRRGRWLTKEYMYGDPNVGIEDMWIDRLAEQSDYYAYCSICNKDAEYNAEGSLILSDYCPNCGARMGGDA